ncbi:MAG: thrombospondin type 3 repeat-containing protein [Candidatus Paceibacterota bacterium]
MNGRFLKKNVVLVAVVTGALLISASFVLVALKHKGAVTTKGVAVNKNLEQIVTQTVSVDSDNDGLKDWEEILFGTDPQNPDSDNDGILDGQEEDIAQTPGSIDREKVEALAHTDKLAFQLFEGYIDLKQRRYLGTNIEENFVAGLVEDSLPEISYTQYSSKDFTIDTKATPSEKERVRTYRSALNVAWSPLFLVKEDELITFTRIVEDGDKKGIAKLQFAKEKYEEAIKNMLRVSVPSDAVTLHTDILNGFSFFIGVLDTMIQVENDPLSALVAVEGYAEGEGRIRASIERFKTYLLLKGITK